MIAGGPAGYAMFRQGGRDVVGLRPGSSEPRWVLYVKVASLDATAQRAAGLGATGDMAAARAFYAALFDWRLDQTTRFENGPHGYTLFKVGDRGAGLRARRRAGVLEGCAQRRPDRRAGRSRRRQLPDRPAAAA